MNTDLNAKNVSKFPFVRVELGIGEKKIKQVDNRTLSYFAKRGVRPKKHLKSFRVTEDAIVPNGTKLDVRHFVVGQLIDVGGMSKGHGTQGVMQRWGFAGGNKSHGASKSHRQIGGIGGCQDPGRVFKGKKMPGKMGYDHTWQYALKVMKVDPVRQVLFIRGSIPGPQKSWVEMRDAWLKPAPVHAPFPTFVPSEDDTNEVTIAEASEINPFMPWDFVKPHPLDSFDEAGYETDN